MTLVQFWTNEKTQYQSRKTAAASQLVQLQKDLDVAKKTDLKAAQDAAAALEATIAAKRIELAKASTADAQALTIELRDLQIQQRIKNGEILDLQEKVEELQANAKAQGQALQRLTTRLAEAEAALKSAEDAQSRRDKLKTRVTTSPVKDVPGLANTAKTGPDHNSAETKINQLPSELRDLAQKRLAYRTTRLANARAQALAVEDAHLAVRKSWGAEDVVAEDRAAFLRAEQAVQEMASAAQAEYDRALKIFQAIAADSLLTANEVAALPATAARTAAAANADTVIDSQIAVEAAALDLDTTEFGKLAADPDANLSADATVNGKKTALATARTTLGTDSTTNYPDKAVTDEWQSLVPDRGWKSVVDFHDAKATVTRLATLVPATLVSNMDSKEAAYVTALAALAKTRRRLEYLEDLAGRRSEHVATLTASRPLRFVSAVRGDSF